MAETFENNHGIIEATTESYNPKADFLIATQIRDFQAEYAQDTNTLPTIKVTIVASILELPDKKFVKRIVKTKQQTLNENSMRYIIDGFEGLLQEALHDIVIEIPQTR